MKPFDKLSLQEVEELRLKSCSITPGSDILYRFTESDIDIAQDYLQSLYHNRVNRTFAERILLLYAIHYLSSATTTDAVFAGSESLLS